MMDRLTALQQVDRPVLGDHISLSLFRMFRQFSALHAAEILGDKGAHIVFVHAGRSFGQSLGASVMDESLDAYLSKIVALVKDTGIGLLSLTEHTEGQMVFSLEECITCAGMPNLGKKICAFEVGIVAGVVGEYLKRPVHGWESKCNVNGDDFCEVTLKL